MRFAEIIELWVEDWKTKEAHIRNGNHIIAWSRSIAGAVRVPIAIGYPTHWTIGTSMAICMGIIVGATIGAVIIMMIVL